MKNINNFYKKYSKCNDCNIKRRVKRYYDKKEKISIQQNIYFEENGDKLLRKENEYKNKKTTDY